MVLLVPLIGFWRVKLYWVAPNATLELLKNSSEFHSPVPCSLRKSVCFLFCTVGRQSAGL